MRAVRGMMLVLFLLLLSFLLPQPAAAPIALPPARVTVATVPVATTTLQVASSTPNTTEPDFDNPKTPATPAREPEQSAQVPKIEKVEDLKITLNQAIESFNQQAAAQPGSINDRVRGALINILCTTESGGPFNSISSSGVIIDPRGVILTNAHVAQYFLLSEFVTCSIRTGSPAVPAYYAELLFIPPSWIEKNAEKIDDERPTGNGEHDYALLRITGATEPEVSLPPQFPFLLTALYYPTPGTDVLVAGYAAGFLGGISVQKELYASSAFSKIGEVYTYGTTTADLFSVGGTIVAQQGSSGGAVATTDGTLIGTIATASIGETTGTSDLRAIATAYIVRDFEQERGKSLESLLSSNLGFEAALFEQLYAPALREALLAVFF